eukprot:gene43439-53103_t
MSSVEVSDAWHRLFERELGSGTSSDLLVKLVSYGDSWNARQPKELANFHQYHSNPLYRKVPGCMANVYVRLDSADADYPNRIKILGAADSRVAQGLLAFLAEGLQRMSSADALALSPSLLTQQLGLNQLLPVGRLNGFTNILLLVQDLIREQERALLSQKNYTGSRSSTATEQMEKSASEPPEVLYAGREDEVAMLLSGGVDSSVALKL